MLLSVAQQPDGPLLEFPGEQKWIPLPVVGAKHLHAPEPIVAGRAYRVDAFLQGQDAIAGQDVAIGIAPLSPCLGITSLMWATTILRRIEHRNLVPGRAACPQVKGIETKPHVAAPSDVQDLQSLLQRAKRREGYRLQGQRHPKG